MVKLYFLDWKWLLVSLQSFQLFLPQLLLLSSKRWPRSKLLNLFYTIQNSVFSEVDAKCASADYPPCGLSAGVRALPQWIQLGCGSSEYICAERGATFSADNPPAQLPDLSNHNSFFAETLRKNPGLWAEYKDKKTSLGVTFGHCIKTGVDNKGKFDWVIWGQIIKFILKVTQWSRPSVPSLVMKNHTLFSTNSSTQSSLTDTTVTPPMPVTQLTWMSASSLPPQSIQLASTSLPPDAELAVPSVEPDSHHAPPSKKDVKSKELLSRVFSTWPVTSLVLTSHWLDPAHTLLCQVWPMLRNSCDVIISGGMTEEKENSLRSRGNLFQEPDSTLLLSSGCGTY